MRNLLMTLAYDGTNYRGWQRLTGRARSVQGTVEKALERTLGEAVEIIGAGRTDAGVHAEGQAANFHTQSERPPDEVLRGLNAALPKDVVCVSLLEVPERFHARYWASFKSYRYRVLSSPIRDPFADRYSLHVPDPLDIPAMEAAAKELVGTRDFSAFTNLKGGRRSRERRLESVEISRQGPFLDILFTADGFLYNQARIMAQTLIEAGLGRIEVEGIRGLLEKRDRSAAPGAAPASGLCLVRVSFRSYDASPEEGLRRTGD